MMGCNAEQVIQLFASVVSRLTDFEQGPVKVFSLGNDLKQSSFLKTHKKTSLGGLGVGVVVGVGEEVEVKGGRFEA